MKTLMDLVVRKHTAIATTLFGAAVLGSFYYTVNHGRSAFVDAHTLITGKEDTDSLPDKATYTYQMRFR